MTGAGSGRFDQNESRLLSRPYPSSDDRGAVAVTTNIYVDGFNLYYGLRRWGPGHKWLDLEKLANLSFPQHSVKRVRCFSARVRSRPPDLQKPVRQDIDWQALETLPRVSLFAGDFRSDVKRFYSPSLGKTIDVVREEEKGSDVNLATYLLLDAFRADCEQAVVISNDGDLKESLRVVGEEFGKRVVLLSLLNPHMHRNRVLPCGEYRPLRQGVVAASQFPVRLRGTRGQLLRRPTGW